jgi:N6-adenosine-specific RNA methylase IME4
MKYGAILSDPPWRFENWSSKGEKKNAKRHYQTMSLEDLRELELPAAADDCALLMWVVDAHMPHALELIEAWGFIYKTVAFIWVKPSIGMGYWSRKQAELCLLATKGRPKRLSGGVRQVIEAPRREHSRKPDEIYRRIEQLVGGPYLEMFARQSWPGWDACGAEMDKFEAEA